ncbi:hypothetical protein KCM76_22515 [Zooshikella marina]|nr:hypothetical protein [Zooshikella ganghwensis]MBU2708784.1 hypothetical protein [Zooshikella ganghwensis]
MASGIETISKTLLENESIYGGEDRLADIYTLSNRLKQELELIIQD